MSRIKPSKFVEMQLNVGLRRTDTINLLFTSKNDSEPFSSIADIDFLVVY